MEKISVILTTYNSEKFLQNTLDSILHQQGIGDLFDLELIAIDDCSSDNTLGILSNNKVTYFQTITNSGGPNKGRNIGLSKVKGDFICFIDHDDVWEEEKLARQLPICRRYPIVSTGYRLVDKLNNRDVNRSSNFQGLITYKENETFVKWLAKDKNKQNLYFSTVMIQSRLKTVKFEEHFGVVDYDWFLRILEGNKSAEVTECLMSRFVKDSNLSLNSTYRNKDYYYSLFVLEDYEAKYPEEVKAAVQRLNGTRARYFYLFGNMKNARRYFLKTSFSLKQVLFLTTSYIGNGFVRKHFHFFG